MIVTKKIKSLLLTTMLFWMVTPAIAQVNHAQGSGQLKSFYTSLAEVNLNFTFPEGFKEIKAINSESFPFDYAMEMPGADFEIWLRVNTQKENERLLADKNIHPSSPDSVFVNIAQEQLAAFTSDRNYLKRGLPPHILDRYNADEGSTYLLSLDDSQVTKHYKYALLIILQKNRMGTVMAVCFTNEKGPEFFKDMNRAGNCIKFKQ
jgi:hypothetical protein